MRSYVFSAGSSVLGNIRGAKIRSSIRAENKIRFHVRVRHPGYFNANAKDANTTKYTINWSFLGSRSKPPTPEAKVYVGLLVFCFITILAAYWIDNLMLGFFCLGLILGPPLVLALADTFYPLEEVSE